MKRKGFWAVVIPIAASLPLVGNMAVAGQETEKTAAFASKGEGTDPAPLILSPEAAERLDIRTAPVREHVVSPSRKFPGEVISVRKDIALAIVQVALTENEMKRVRRDAPALVLPLARNGKAPPIQSLPIQDPMTRGLYEDRSLYYETSDANHGLVFRQFVQVELPLLGGIEARKAIPYAAVLYDATGKTWAYTNPERLVFVRHPIVIDTIVANEAILTDGPPCGTAVVTVGVAELHGAEVGVGK